MAEEDRNYLMQLAKEKLKGQRESLIRSGKNKIRREATEKDLLQRNPSDYKRYPQQGSDDTLAEYRGKAPDPTNPGVPQTRVPDPVSGKGVISSMLSAGPAGPLLGAAYALSDAPKAEVDGPNLTRMGVGMATYPYIQAATAPLGPYSVPAAITGSAIASEAAGVAYEIGQEMFTDKEPVALGERMKKAKENVQWEMMIVGGMSGGGAFIRDTFQKLVKNPDDYITRAGASVRQVYNDFKAMGLRDDQMLPAVFGSDTMRAVQNTLSKLPFTGGKVQKAARDMFEVIRGERDYIVQKSGIISDETLAGRQLQRALKDPGGNKGFVGKSMQGFEDRYGQIAEMRKPELALVPKHLIAKIREYRYRFGEMKNSEAALESPPLNNFLKDFSDRLETPATVKVPVSGEVRGKAKPSFKYVNKGTPPIHEGARSIGATGYLEPAKSAVRGKVKEGEQLYKPLTLKQGEFLFSELERWLSVVGDARGAPKGFENLSKSQLAELYQAGMRDLDEAMQQQKVYAPNGDTMYEAWKATREDYREFKNQLKLLDDIITAPTGWQAFQAALKGATHADEKMVALKDAVVNIAGDNQAWDEFVATNLWMLGNATPGKQAGPFSREFSVAKWLTEYHKYNTSGVLDVLFSGKPGLKKEWDRLFRTASAYDDMERFANFSNTARETFMQDMLTLGKGRYMGFNMATMGQTLLMAMSVVGLPLYQTHKMMDPKFIKWLADGYSVSTARINDIKHWIARYIQDNQANPDERYDVKDTLKYLEGTYNNVWDKLFKWN